MTMCAIPEFRGLVATYFGVRGGRLGRPHIQAVLGGTHRLGEFDEGNGATSMAM